MYESPIKILEQHFNDNVIQVLDDFRQDKDEAIYKAIVRLGIVVNEEELIKALQYDRQQYEKGYEDAVKEFAERVKNCLIQIIISTGIIAKLLMMLQKKW